MVGFPTIEDAADGKRRWSWQAVTSNDVTVPTEELANSLHAEATSNLLAAEPWEGQHGQSAAASTHLNVSSAGDGTYELAVTAPTRPSDWDMAFTFGVMQAFDRIAGPVVEVQGRPRAQCPPWYLSLERASSG
jgi:hypothetical protein